MLIHHWIYPCKIMILQILESFNSKCSKSNLFKYLKNEFYEVHLSKSNSPESNFHVYSWSNPDSSINHRDCTAQLSKIVRVRFWLRLSSVSVSGTNKVLVFCKFGHLRKLIRLKFFTNILSSLITSILQISSYLIFIKSSFRIKTEISIKHFRFEKTKKRNFWNFNSK